MQQFDALVTGGSGFIGLAAVEQFLLGGKSVAILDRLTPPREFLDYAQTLPGSVEVLQADIADKDAILHCLSRFQPDVVVHAAVATPDMHRERRTPELAVQTNIVGTQNLLEALRVSPVRRLVHLSTSGVYGDIANRPGFSESSVLETVLPDPVTIYALTKASAEKLVLRYRDLFGMDAVCARVGLSWGPWEYDTGVRDPFSTPLQLLRVASAGGAAHLPRDPVKDWAYSRDIGRAIVILSGSQSLPSTIYNLGCDDVWPVSAWAERLRKAFPGFTCSIAPDSKQSGAQDIEVYGAKDRAPLNVDRLKSETDFVFEYRTARAFEDYLEWASRFQCWRNGKA